MAAYRPKRQRRSNGEGSIYQAADDRWRGTLTVTHPNTGQQARRYVSGRSRAEVVRKIDGLRREAATGAYPTGITTAEFLAGWLEASKQRIRPATWRQYESLTRLHLVPAFGRTQLARLLPADVERMTAGLLDTGRSAGTAILARTVLRRALADAQRDGLVGRNVAALARPPRRVQHELRYLDTTELRQLLTACEDHPIGPMVTLAATTGMRMGELLGLTWDDVDVASGRVAVRRALARAWDGGWALAEPKTPRSRRTLHLPGQAARALERQRDRQAEARAVAGKAWQDRDGLVFTDAVGRHLRPEDVNHAWHRLLDQAGLPHLPFHGLRHSAATALLTAGVPLKVVSETLGHSTVVLTADTYAAVVPELRREAAEAMERVLG